MVRVIRYKVYAVYDFEDDVITIAKTIIDANRIAKYYGGYVKKEYLIKRVDK